MERKDILKLAKMARIKLSEEEIESFADLEPLHSFFQTLDSIDVTDVKPMVHPLEQSQRLRSDEPNLKIDRNSIQASALHTQEFIYLVPENIEKPTD